MNVISVFRPLLRTVVRIDRSKITHATGLVNALGVFAPLAVGAAVGQAIPGLTVSNGALNVAFSDQPGSYRLRIGRMLVAGICGALSVFVGSATGNVVWLTVVLSAVWGLGGGLMVALGPAAEQIGVTSIVLLLVYGAYPLSAAGAAEQGGLILAGGAIQALLSAAAWPVRPFGPERAALAALFRRLAEYVREPAGAENPPPASTEMINASAMLVGIGSTGSSAGEAFRALLDEADRIRRELLALNGVRRRIGDTNGDAALVRCIDDIWDAAGDVLSILADALMMSAQPADSTEPMRRIETASEALRAAMAESADPIVQLLYRDVLAHVEALSGQLRACLEIDRRAGPQGDIAWDEVQLPPNLRLRGAVEIVRANLTLRSASFRHAVRLSAALAAAGVLANGVGLARAYWVPLTVAIVLKPDFTSTFSRGLLRVAGTIVGLALTTGLVYVAFRDEPARVVLVGVLVFVIRSFGPANFGVSAVGITSLVVILTSFAGAPPESTIVERGVNTIIGGAIALLAYAVWPTWERTQIRAVLADLLDAYRRYFDAVITGYLDAETAERGSLEAARLAARLARSNAEASIDRLRSEPVQPTLDLDTAEGLLTSSHRFVHAAMALETETSHHLNPRAQSAFRTFAGDVDVTLQALARSLRDPLHPLDGLPDLREDQRALIEAAIDRPTQENAAFVEGAPPSTLFAETDRITNSLNTMTHVMRQLRDGVETRQNAE